MKEASVEKLIFKRPQPLIENITRKGFQIRGGAWDNESEEKDEILDNRLLKQETANLRQSMQLEVHGKTDADLEKDADAFLKANGFEDLVEEPKK